MKNRGKTMKHDEQERNKTRKQWWKRVEKTMKHNEEEKKLGNMMKNRETTMKNDEK